MYYSKRVLAVLLTMIVTGAARSVAVKLFFQVGFEKPIFVTLLYLLGQSFSLILYYMLKWYHDWHDAKELGWSANHSGQPNALQRKWREFRVASSRILSSSLRRSNNVTTPHRPSALKSSLKSSVNAKPDDASNMMTRDEENLADEPSSVAFSPQVLKFNNNEASPPDDDSASGEVNAKESRHGLAIGEQPLRASGVRFQDDAPTTETGFERRSDVRFEVSDGGASFQDSPDATRNPETERRLRSSGVSFQDSAQTTETGSERQKVRLQAGDDAKGAVSFQDSPDATRNPEAKRRNGSSVRFDVTLTEEDDAPRRSSLVRFDIESSFPRNNNSVVRFGGDAMVNDDSASDDSDALDSAFRRPSGQNRQPSGASDNSGSSSRLRRSSLMMHSHSSALMGKSRRHSTLFDLIDHHEEDDDDTSAHIEDATTDDKPSSTLPERSLKKRGSVHGLTSESMKAVEWIHNVPFWQKMLIPAFFNLANSVMRWTSLLFVEASIYEILMSGVDLILSVFAARFMRKRLVSTKRRIAVLIIAAGVVLVGYAGTMTAGEEEGDEGDSDSNSTKQQIVGYLLIVGKCAMSVFQDMAEEVFLQEADIPVLELLGYEGIFGVVIGCIIYFPLAANSLIPNESLAELGEKLGSNGGSIAVFAVALTFLFTFAGIFNILATAETSAVTRNVWKNFRTALVWAFGLIIFYSAQNEDIGEEWIIPGSFFILLGFGIMLLGANIYYQQNTGKSKARTSGHSTDTGASATLQTVAASASSAATSVALTRDSSDSSGDDADDGGEDKAPDCSATGVTPTTAVEASDPAEDLQTVHSDCHGSDAIAPPLQDPDAKTFGSEQDDAWNYNNPVEAEESMQPEKASAGEAQTRGAQEVDGTPTDQSPALNTHVQGDESGREAEKQDDEAEKQDDEAEKQDDST